MSQCEKWKILNALVAIPSNNPGGINGSITQHFGHCDLYVLVDIKNGMINSVSSISTVPPLQDYQKVKKSVILMQLSTELSEQDVELMSRESYRRSIMINHDRHGCILENQKAFMCRMC